MSKKNSSALRRLEAHNHSPQPESSRRAHNSQDRESNSRSRSHEQSPRDGSNRHSHSRNQEERVPDWAKQLLEAHRESDQRLIALEKELKTTSKQIGRKREHSPVAEFKFKRNKVQYELNKSVLKKIEAALEESDEEASRVALDEGRELLIQRNKHIKLAEKYGWETVDCYIQDPLASDSDDEKKIRRAIKESKVLKEDKRKAARTYKPSSIQSRLGVQVSSQRNPSDAKGASLSFRRQDS